MSIKVFSEIGRLRRVLLHRPGLEIDWMVPSMMGQLLFDDILYGDQARAEHERFADVLRVAGVETLYAQDLLAEVLEAPEVRSELCARLETDGDLAPGCRGQLEEMSAGDLAAAAICGLRNPEGYQSTETRLYDLAPVPNYFFQRDPHFLVGERVFLSSMATDARRREPLVSEMIFRHHPDLACASRPFSIAAGDPEARYPTGGDTPCLEGGDVLVANAETLLVGVSQRTNRRGVERLAEYLRREETSFRQLILVDLPTQRTYMHLDTVFTLVDEGLCLAFLPVIQPRRRLSAQAFWVDLGAKNLSFSLRPSVLEAIAEAGLDLEPIPCGASQDVLEQAREQWTDGANAFTVSPGLILLYRRNRRTLDELSSRGWNVVDEEEILSGRRQIREGEQTVITVLGNELSRARGGPRCMTMPLEREA